MDPRIMTQSAPNCYILKIFQIKAWSSMMKKWQVLQAVSLELLWSRSETVSALGSTTSWKLQNWTFLVRYCVVPHCDSHLFLNTVCKYILEKCPLFGLWSFCLLPQGCGTLRCFSLDLPLTKHCGSWLRQVGILSAFMSDYWSGGKPLCVWYGVLVLSLFLCISAHLFHLHLYLSFSVKLGIFFIYLPGTVHPDDATERKRGNTLLTFYRFISYLTSEQQKPESFSYSLSFYLLT